MPDSRGALGDLGLLIVRLAAGLMLIGFHGWSKLVAAFGYVFQGQEWRFVEGVAGMGFPWPGFFAVCAALAESVGALLLAAGLFTRYAAAFVAINFVVATYRHLSTDMRFELAAMYLAFALLFLLGTPGRYALDSILRRGR
jgi:putative oxidoreductase